MSDGAPLRILLFGGFEVWREGRQLQGFESQKVRMLLAYLLLNRERPHPREHLASLLWPERDDDSSRRNLRQAIYNIKETVADGAGQPLLLVDRAGVQVDPAASYWLDVDAFSEALRLAPVGNREVASHSLVEVATLYRGELLAGFYFDDCAELGDWLVAQQEKLREAASEAMRALVQVYLARGEYRLGIQYARRLVAMDPLSEESHRELMQLYALAGQRNRAIAHYRDLQTILDRELGVEPLEETTELYQTVLRESVLEAAQLERPLTARPIIPLVGREAAIEQLRECWAAVLQGRPQVTVVEGEEGVGKTRLIRSFLDMATARRPAVVLTGRCTDRFPQPPYRPFVQMLRQASDLEADGDAPTPRRGISRALARLMPEVEARRRRSSPPATASLSDERHRLFHAIGEALAAVAAGEHGPGEEPLLLFVDELQWADPATAALFAHLSHHPPKAPIWLIGARTPPPAGAPLLRLAESVVRVPLARLPEAAVVEIARSLVAEAQVADLLDRLEDAQGLPLGIAALVGTLWDEGTLASVSAGEPWQLRHGTSTPRSARADAIDDLIRGRLRRLPTSARRLASLAAIAGERFDAELLCRAEDEHPSVVEIGLEILLERWLVRSAPQRWNRSGLEAGLGPWSRGLRGGGFEFDHERIRRVIYGDVNPLRKQVLHAQVVRALESLPDSGGTDGLVEELAYHALLANEWEAAVRHLEAAAETALARGAPGNALTCLDRALQVLERLAANAADTSSRFRWRAEAERITAAAAMLAAAIAVAG